MSVNPPDSVDPRSVPGEERTGYVVNCRESEYDVYIGRPSKWGNPFIVGKDGSRAVVIRKYLTYLGQHPDLATAAKAELRGKVLGCYCAPLPCHGDILAAVAND